MPLIAEDGTGLANANSYVTWDIIEVFAEERSWSDWATATDEAKEIAILDATIYLDTSYLWKGSIKLEAQALAWPRESVFDREGRELAGVPQRIKDACCELARMKLTAALVASRTEGEVQSLTAGSVSITYARGNRVSEGEKYGWIDRLVTGLHGGRAGGLNVQLSKS
jgi:hypothetical protein